MISFKKHFNAYYLIIAAENHNNCDWYFRGIVKFETVELKRLTKAIGFGCSFAGDLAFNRLLQNMWRQI